MKLNARQFFEALRDLHELRGAQSYAQEYVSAGSGRERNPGNGERGTGETETEKTERDGEG